MKNFPCILIFTFIIAVSINATAQTYPQNRVIDNSEYLPSGGVQSVPLDGQYLWVNDGVYFFTLDFNTSFTNALYFGAAVEGDFDDKGTFYYVNNIFTYSNLYKIDLATGISTLIAPLNGSLNSGYDFIVSMSYYNGKMYAAFVDNDETDIFLINLEDGSCNKITSTPIPGFYTAMAFNSSGKIYGVDGLNDNLYLLNISNCTRSLIGDTNLLNTYDICDADFNNNDNQLYYTGYGGTFIINTSTGQSTLFSILEGNVCATSTLSSQAVPFNKYLMVVLFVLIAGTIAFRRLILR